MNYYYPPVPLTYTMSSVSTAATGAVNAVNLQSDMDTVGRLRTVSGAWLSTANGTKNLTVTLTGHGLTTGAFVQIQGVSAGPYNGIPAAEINTRAAVTVVDANTFTIQSSTNATGSGAVTPTTDSRITIQQDGGGGTVYIPAGTYSVTGPVWLVSGVTVEGVRPTLQNNRVPIAGTILDGVDYTQRCFAYNTTDGAADYANITLMNNDSLNGTGLRNLTFKRFTDAVRIGALYKMGVFFGFFEHLYVYDCSGWGFYFENCSYSTFRNLECRGTASGGTAGDRGLAAWVASTVVYNQGNNRIDFVFGESAQSYTRGVMFRARGNTSTGAKLNDMQVTKIQVNGSGTAQTDTGTPDGAGTAPISVTNSALWPIDLPVTVTATSNGLFTNNTYFVVASAANKIQLASTVRGTPLTFATATTVSLKAYGYACLETVGTSENSGNAIQPSSFNGLDLEGPTGMAVLAQNAGGDWNVNTAEYGQGSGCINTFVFKGSCYGTYKATGNFTSENSTSYQGLMLMGGQVWSGAVSAFPAQAPIGFWYQGSPLRWTMNFANQITGSTKIGSLYCPDTPSTGSYQYPIAAMGQRINTWSSAAKNFTAAESGAWAYTGGATTATLPALIAALPAVSTASVTGGQTWEITNAGTGTLTLNTNAGTELFNKILTKTQLTIPAGASITLRAMTDGSTPFWATGGAWGTVT